ncbi:lymphotoxin-alpha isoform 2-T2 [Menidia menidia]
MVATGCSGLREEDRDAEAGAPLRGPTRAWSRELRGARFWSFVVPLVLFAAVLVLLVAAGAKTRCPPSADHQTGMQPSWISPDIPRARLTGTENTPKAHRGSSGLMGYSPREEKPEGEYLRWQFDLGHAYCRGGFNCSSEHLLVPREGYYRVSLQLTYEGECTNDTSGKRLVQEVYVFAEDYPQDVVLLSAVDTATCAASSWSKSLYTAGTFRLKAKDKLRVKAKQRRLLVKTESQVFFAAELLPE